MSDNVFARLTEPGHRRPDIEVGFDLIQCPECGDECASRKQHAAYLMPLGGDHPTYLYWCPCGAIWLNCNGKIKVLASIQDQIELTDY